MSNKCEWKGTKAEGQSTEWKFYPCDNFDGRFLERDLPDDKDNPNYCLYCKTDIRKPEEKPLIVKSGNTWVAYFEGVDYLCIDPNNTTGTIEAFLNQLKLSNIWKPFLEIIINDEIAKLRPMVITEVLPENCPSLLCRVSYNSKNHTEYGACEYNDKLFSSCLFRLATPHELQNQ